MSEMVKLVHETDLAKDTLAVQWLLTNLCNFSCSYCPSYLNNGSSKGPELEAVKSFILRLKEHYKGKSIYLELSGGEVTTYKDFEKLLDFLNEQGIKAGILSNGARSLSFWEKNLPKLDKLILSYHPEEGKSEHLYELVSMALYKVPLHINILMKPDKFSECLALANRISALHPNLSIALQKITKVENDRYLNEIIDYSSKQKLILSEQIFKKPIDHESRELPQKHYRGGMLIIDSDGVTQKRGGHYNTENNWKGWECSAGIENLSIQFSGDIYRGLCKVGGRIGNIKDEKTNFPTNNIICNQEACRCGFDISCTKTR